jgi:hypothetical protein
MAAAIVLVIGLACAPEQVDPVGDDDDEPLSFTVVALPDTQVYADEYPEMFDAQTAWIAEQAAALNIAFVTHLGDVVDNGPSDRQWANADASLTILDQAGVRYGVAMGNHDNMYSDFEYQYGADVDHSCSAVSNDIDCDAVHYKKWGGPVRIDDHDWYGAASPSGQSHYEAFQFGEYEFLFLHLAVDPRAEERGWGEQVLDDHPTALVHLTTHRYLYDFRIVDIMPDPLPLLTGGRNNALIHGLLGQDLYYIDSIPAEDLFTELIATHPNIYMVQCGHVDSEYRQQTDNDAGLPVFEIMTDFQSFHPQGGDGWLKTLTYDLDAGTLQVRTYSPTLDEYRANGDGLDVSLEILGTALDSLGSYLESMGLDTEELAELLEYWTTTEEGRQEYLEAAYGDGQRDSEFLLDVDFAAYATASD